MLPEHSVLTYRFFLAITLLRKWKKAWRVKKQRDAELETLNKSITDEDASTWAALVAEATDARARDPKAMDQYVLTMKKGKHASNQDSSACILIVILSNFNEGD